MINSLEELVVDLTAATTDEESSDDEMDESSDPQPTNVKTAGSFIHSFMNFGLERKNSCCKIRQL